MAGALGRGLARSEQSLDLPVKISQEVQASVRCGSTRGTRVAGAVTYGHNGPEACNALTMYQEHTVETLHIGKTP